MFRKLLTLLALGLLLAPVAHAQTVDEILAKHYEAQGGLEKLKALNSRRLSMNFCSCYLSITMFVTIFLTVIVY